MCTTKMYSRWALAFLITLLFAPTSSQADGFLSQMLNQTVGTVISNMKHQVTSISRQATQEPGQQVHTNSVEGPTGKVPKNPNAVALVRKFRPIVPSYSGGPVDMLGVRLGMTLPQAEDIAKKTYASNPRVVYAGYSFQYKEARVTSRPFAKYVRYTKTAANTTDQLQLTFNSPVGDHRIVSLERLINFADHASDEPLATAIQASLIKKYGSPAAKQNAENLAITLWWVFTPNARLPCAGGLCFNHPDGTGAPTFGGPMLKFDNGIYPFDLTSEGSYDKMEREHQCGAINPGSATFVSNNDVRIQATISLNRTDSSKVLQLEVNSYYTKPCLDALLGARSQMKAAAIQRYESISKNPAAPSL